MGRLKIYDSSTPRDQLVKEREASYRLKTSLEKFFELLALIRLSIKLNNNTPLKSPQGKVWRFGRLIEPLCRLIG